MAFPSSLISGLSVAQTPLFQRGVGRWYYNTLLATSVNRVSHRQLFLCEHFVSRLVDSGSLWKVGFWGLAAAAFVCPPPHRLGGSVVLSGV